MPPPDDCPEFYFPALEPVPPPEHMHHYQMACNETTFVRYCVVCGETAYITQLEHWPQKWTYVRGEAE